jgi:hypothetical protein
VSEDSSVDLDAVAQRWQQRFSSGIEVVGRSDSDLEVHRHESHDALPTAKSLVGWFVPDDGIVYARIPVHIPADVAESSQGAVDAAISCLEHFESELAGRGWRITDDGTLRDDGEAYVFDATVKSVVTEVEKAFRLLRDLADDPIAYEVG